MADDPSAILHTPAGLALQPGTRIYASVGGYVVNGEFQNLQGLSETANERIHRRSRRTVLQC